MTAPADPATTAAPSILDEHRTSPGLLLALLGQEAMHRLRAPHAAHNLKPRQFQILGLLRDHGGLARRELVQEMGVAPSIRVTAAHPLEADGLVARERDPADRRRHLVTLTAAGERRLASASRAQKRDRGPAVRLARSRPARAPAHPAAHDARRTRRRPGCGLQRGGHRAMKPTVFGGVGREVVTRSLEAGHEVRAYVHNAAKLTVTHPPSR